MVERKEVRDYLATGSGKAKRTQVFRPPWADISRKPFPTAKATFIPGAGHLWVVDHVGDILDALIGTREDCADS